MECLKDPVSRQHVIKKIGLIVREEMKCMCSDRTNSVLISQEKTYLSMFSWDKLLGELEENAPILLAILRECTQTKVPRPNQMSVLACVLP